MFFSKYLKSSKQNLHSYVCGMTAALVPRLSCPSSQPPPGSSSHYTSLDLPLTLASSNTPRQGPPA